jgi:hypothetical protein
VWLNEKRKVKVKDEKMDTKQDTTVRDSGIKVGAVVPVPAVKEVIFERKISPKAIADDLTSRITGTLVNYPDLFDPATGQFKTEDQLKAVGACFITVSYNKVLGGSDTVKKGRTTKNPTPFIRKTSRFQVIANINWQSYINRRSEHGRFIASPERANGVANYEDCKAIGAKGDNYYICGVAFRVLEATRYFDIQGQEYPDAAFIKSEYLTGASTESKQREADKHGIELPFDPQYRTTRIDSCDSIRAFGFDFIPTP